MRQVAPVKASMNRGSPSRKRERAQWLDRVDLASFFVRAPAALVLLDPDLKILMVSESLAGSCGFSLRQILGKTPSQLIPSIPRKRRSDSKTRCQNWPCSTQLRDCRGASQLPWRDSLLAGFLFPGCARPRRTLRCGRYFHRDFQYQS